MNNLTYEQVIKLGKEREKWRLSPEGRDKHKRDMERLDERLRRVK